MHFLADHYRSEFLACPGLVRFDYAKGRDGFEPTLLVKGDTLVLKYITSGVRMQLAFAEIGGRLLYGLRLHDDDAHPAFFWSVLEYENEKRALAALVAGQPFPAFLFNEIAVNVAWGETVAGEIPRQLSEMLKRAETGRVDHSLVKDDASEALTALFAGEGTAVRFMVDIAIESEWHPITSHFITSHASSSLIQLFDPDEGNQQEQIAVWLTDNLHPLGVHHSPQVPKDNGFRELTDVLLSYEYGSILFESKALAIYTRQELPTRKKLSRDVSAHITKAIGQLRGGIRQLKSGTPVFTKSGKEIEVERSQPIHGIVLIPDLDLIDDRAAWGLDIIEEFMKATGGFLHILDPSELLRMVQAAEMIASRGTTTTPMMAFDYYLIERAKMAMSAETLCIEVLLRFEDA